MKCLGVAIKKNEIWYSEVEGTSMKNAMILESGKQNYRADSPTLMLDFNNIFIELITKFRPDIVSYKLSLDIKMQQIPYLHYSLGILNLICLQNGISIVERSNRWITANKRAKIVNFETYFTNKVYKNEELAASLIAWYEIGE